MVDKSFDGVLVLPDDSTYVGHYIEGDLISTSFGATSIDDKYAITWAGTGGDVGLESSVLDIDGAAAMVVGSSDCAYVDSRRHGDGKMRSSDGGECDGRWREGLQDGIGWCSTARGCDIGLEPRVLDIDGAFDALEGAGVDSRQHGDGKLRSPNGGGYDGQWHEGLQDGINWCSTASSLGSRVLDIDGAAAIVCETLESACTDSRRHGDGKLRSPDGGEYDGQWPGGLQDGIGWCSTARGDKYRGQWLKGKMHGRGTFTSKEDGSIYEVEYRDNRRHGRGSLRWPDGRLLEGHWRDDQQSGTGRYTDDDGVTLGAWEAGELVAAIVHDMP